VRVVARRLVLAVVVGLALAGCSTTVVTGTASPGKDVPVDVAAATFPITGVSDTPIDRLARNALADLDAFWSDAYPDFFGEAYRPLENGYFSVDSADLDESAYPTTGIGCAGSPTAPDSVADNAFYDPGCDLIAYDRDLLEELATDYGRFLVPVVMAHEFGHAMQARFGFAESGRGIQDETQADCLAGAWTAWVANGNSEHLTMRTPELDDVVRGFLMLRDDVGSDPDDTEAHGSYFDRVSAFYEGFSGGVAPCRDDFGADRVFTAAAFTSDLDSANRGDAPYRDIVGWIGQTLPLFWGTVFRDALGTDFRPPALEPFSGTPPDCGGLGGDDRDLGYCTGGRTVYYDESDLTRRAYEELGDFAVATALSLPYALAARAQAGLSTDDAAATESAVCLTGWYAAQWYGGAFADSLEVTLSPGDLDEAVQFLLTYGVDPRVLPDAASSGFELVGAFRTGFLDGGTACDLTS
jgi:predicted metalloprotease